jgi:hypothetical protein
MADSAAPPMTIRAAVRDLADHTPMEIESLGAPTSHCRHARRRRNTMLAIGFELVVGAALGAAVHYASTAAPWNTTVVQTLTVSAPPGQLTPTIAASQRDPVCDEWDTATRTYRAQKASSTARCGRASARPTRYTGHCRASGRPTASAVR